MHMKSISLSILLIVLTISIVYTFIISAKDVDIAQQNKNVKMFSAWVTGAGVVVLVAGLALVGAVIAKKLVVPTMLICIIIVLGLVLTTAGAVGVGTYNDETIDNEHKMDRYVKMSSILGMSSALSVGLFGGMMLSKHQL